MINDKPQSVVNIRKHRGLDVAWKVELSSLHSPSRRFEDSHCPRCETLARTVTLWRDKKLRCFSLETCYTEYLKSAAQGSRLGTYCKEPELIFFVMQDSACAVQTLTEFSVCSQLDDLLPAHAGHHDFQRWILCGDYLGSSRGSLRAYADGICIASTWYHDVWGLLCAVTLVLHLCICDPLQCRVYHQLELLWKVTIENVCLWNRLYKLLGDTHN